MTTTQGNTPLSTSPTSPIDVFSINNLNDTPCQRITKFIDNIGDILSEVDNEHLVKFLQICSERGYDFKNKTPMLSLADCMTTMIRDQNTLEPDSKYYHYYNAMIMEFLQRSMVAINANQEHIDDLNTKINDSLEKFKEFYETTSFYF